MLQSGFYENDVISNDSARHLFYKFLDQCDLVLNTVAFDNLQSAGLDILSNDSIKSKLLNLFGQDFHYVVGLQEEYNRVHFEGVTTLLVDNTDFWSRLSDEDRKFLRNSRSLITRMKLERHYLLARYLDGLKNIKPEVEQLISDIHQEITRLKD
jgi:hypothetical protein